MEEEADGALNYSTFTLRSKFIRNSSVEFAVCDMRNFAPKYRENLPSHVYRCGNKTPTLKRTQVICFQGDLDGKRQMVVFSSKCYIIHRVVDYLAGLKIHVHSGDHGPLKTTLEATG